MQQSCIHFLNEMVMLFTIERICNCEMIPNHMTFSLKNPWRRSGVPSSNHTQTNYAPFLLSAPIFFHLPLWEGVDIRGGKREKVTSGPHFFRLRGYLLRVFHLVFGFFQSSTEFILKWPNKSSQFRHKCPKRQVGEYCMFQQVLTILQEKRPKGLSEKNRFVHCSLKKLWTTPKPHFDEIWSKWYIFQNTGKTTIISKCAKGGSSTNVLGHHSKSLPIPFSNLKSQHAIVY